MPVPNEFDGGEVGKAILDRLGLRIGPEMAAYVARRLASGQADALAGPGGAAIPVMAASARTGVPVRQFVDPSELRAALTA